MTRKSVFRDPDLCVNCKACVIACKVKHMWPPYNTTGAMAEPEGVNLLQVYQYGPEISMDGKVHQPFVSIACMHCEDAPCIKVCPSTAISKDPETRITLVDGDRCIGCKACLWVCPYGAPSYNDDGKMVLCNLCIDRLREGKKTACEAACPASAIYISSPEDISKLRSRIAVERIAKGTME
ncbi:MAG: 4Fe-4S dicluster domain-containing protein [Deltaproteobacteria bacterium]|nr:4Fe-4S dicluster domain-containing protein [Deltaproteobacteria bacterium]